jgi:hypothetical protein
LLAASEPKEVALNAWLKLCRLDVNDEIEKWARVRKWDIKSNITKPRLTWTMQPPVFLRMVELRYCGLIAAFKVSLMRPQDVQTDLLT